MNDKWMNDIRDRYRNYEASEPQGLWHDISRRIPRSAPKRRSAAPLWTRRTLAAAAVLAVAALVAHFALRENAEVKRQVAQLEERQARADAAPRTTPERTRPAAATRQCALLPKADVCTPPQPDAERPHEAAADTAVYAAPTPSAGQSAPQAETEKAVSTEAESAAKAPAGLPRVRHEQRPGCRRTSAPRFALSLSASGTGGHRQSNFSQAVTGAYIGGDAQTDWADDPREFLTQLNKSLDAATEIRHRQPVSLGLTLAYALTPRLSVESGLVYTRLVSDLHDGSQYYYLDGRQTLHYVGLPLRANLRLLSLRRFSLYGKAGVLIEKCVGAKAETEYVAEGEPSIAETEHYATRPYQFSLHTALGAQYSFLPALSLYAEPGLGYYFDDRSSLRTLYKEHPLSLHLEVGLRLTFGKE